MILITGFGSFMNIKKNPSGKIAKYWNGKKINKNKIIGRELPVTFDSVHELTDLINDYNPEIIISTGLYSYNGKIRIEKMAINHIDPIPDNNGKVLEGLIMDDLITYKTRLPVLKIKEELDKNNIPVIESYNAGGFVCNYLFYNLMNYLKDDEEIIAGFIHVPNPNKDFSQKKMNKAFGLIIKTIIGQ